MRSWRLLAYVNSQRFLIRRVAPGIINKNVRSLPYQSLSYDAVDSFPKGEESEQSEQTEKQTRGLWNPHIFGLVSVGVLLCSGKKGIKEVTMP